MRLIIKSLESSYAPEKCSINYEKQKNGFVNCFDIENEKYRMKIFQVTKIKILKFLLLILYFSFEKIN